MSLSIEFYYDTVGVPSGVALSRADFEWEGPDEHLSPVRETPLKNALYGKTNCGLVLISAATLIWAARTMHNLANVSPCIHMAEALLCWQADPRYYDISAPAYPEDDDDEDYVEDEVVETFCVEATSFFMASPGEHTADPEIEATANLICLTRHILDPTPRKLYKAWLKSLIRRLDEIAPNPAQTFMSISDFASPEEFAAYERKNMGEPLPLEAANMSREYSPASGHDLFQTFLRDVDWRTNPNLSSPEDMVALGFVGTPYT